jgi:hypothetical protein
MPIFLLIAGLTLDQILAYIDVYSIVSVFARVEKVPSAQTCMYACRVRNVGYESNTTSFYNLIPDEYFLVMSGLPLCVCSLAMLDC